MIENAGNAPVKNAFSTRRCDKKFRKMISVAQELQVVLRSKFRGCLLGALYGDCFGAQFENEPFSGSGKYMTQRFFDGMDKSTRGGESQL